MPTSHLLLLVAVTCLLLVLHAEALCNFPVDWHGSWFESRDGDVTITSHNFSSKGTCVDRKHDFYLVENREIGCHTCLLMRLRRANVLQYKESFCVGRDSLLNICATIQTENIQYTLIRVLSRPVECPFQDAFHFTYNNNSGGFCRNPTSYVKPCAANSQLRFHFRHCPDAAYTYEREVDIECLATWQENHTNFVIGRLTSRDSTTSKNNLYRCLLYHSVGTVVYAVMSADASCRGLRSARNGPVVMEFTMDVFGWPKPQCVYPPWLIQKTWRDLSGNHVYQSTSALNGAVLSECQLQNCLNVVSIGSQFNVLPRRVQLQRLRTLRGCVMRFNSGAVLSLSFRSQHQQQPEIIKLFRCEAILGRNTTKDQFTAISFISYGCSARYQCVKFVRNIGVLEVHEGKYLEHANEPCHEGDMLASNRRLLVPVESTADRQRTRCPLSGQHTVHTASSECRSFFTIGCSHSSVISITSTCSSKPGLQLECVVTWKANRTQYLVARVFGDNTTTALNCFSFRKKDSMLYFSVDAACNAGTSSSLKDSSTYVMEYKSSQCPSRQPLVSVTEVAVIHSDVIPHNGDVTWRKYGGPYRHIDDDTRQIRHHTSPLYSISSNEAAATVCRTLTCSLSVIISNIICIKIVYCQYLSAFYR